MKTDVKIAFAMCACVTAFACYICARIEVFNAHAPAGGRLPRQRDADWGISKWRVSSANVVRTRWEARLRAEAEDQGRPFAMTPEQEAVIAKEMQEAEENADFRRFVETFGLAQYLVAPGAFCWAVFLAASKRSDRRVRLPSAGLALLSAICLGLALYRGYFSSLGW